MFAWLVGLLVLGIWWCFGGVSVLFWSRVGRDSLVYWWGGVDVLLCFGIVFCRLAGFYGFVLRWVWLCLGGVFVVCWLCVGGAEVTVGICPKPHGVFTHLRITITMPASHHQAMTFGGILVVFWWCGSV